MTDPLTQIVEAAKELPPEQQGLEIARKAMGMIRRADASISDEALADEFRAWWASQGWIAVPEIDDVSVAVAWGRHLLSKGGRFA